MLAFFWRQNRASKNEQNKLPIALLLSSCVPITLNERKEAVAQLAEDNASDFTDSFHATVIPHVEDVLVIE